MVFKAIVYHCDDLTHRKERRISLTMYPETILRGKCQDDVQTQEGTSIGLLRCSH
jgi:hypothetical protein